ncbi:MAG: RHS repeat-associated core domain-containing protein [Verrucomicrobia bacterium]|nr:RHS repeat-associated core domain-containing protein [Verrucomicrobiota bacterium]
MTFTSQKWSYGYDSAQNLVKRTNNTTVETFTVNVLNQLTLIPDSVPSYDRRGNLVSRVASGNIPWKELYYSYDHENRLTCVQTDTYYTPESYRFKVEFVYDGLSRLRIKRNYIWSGGGWYGSGGETRYLYDMSAGGAAGMLIVQERDGANWPTVTYTRGRDLSGTVDGAGGIGGLLARSHGYSSGSWAYHNFYHSDGNGNVTALADSGGTLQASYIYDPYGRYLTGTGTLLTSNVMRFSSKPWVSFLGTSATSGLYYYGYRFYDTYLQRWVNRDPIPISATMNLYAFAQNSAYLYRDFWGLSDELDLPFGPRFTTGNPLNPINCEQLEALIMDLQRNAVGHELYGAWAKAYLEQLLDIWDDYCDDDHGDSECPAVGPAPVPQLQPSPAVFSSSSLRNAPSWSLPWQQPCLTATGSMIIVGGAIIVIECWLNPINGPLPP